jgi:hypothetical protein
MSETSPAYGHDPQGRGLPPGGFPLTPAPTKHVLPSRSIASPVKKRLKAFRVPISYAVDSAIGYQRAEDQFSIFRIRPGTIPEGFQVSHVAVEYAKQSLYIVLEHPSFPEYEPGTLCAEITPIELEQVPVLKNTSPMPYFPDWCAKHGFDQSKLTPEQKDRLISVFLHEEQ